MPIRTRLITKNTDLARTLGKLITDATTISFAVAWATGSTDQYKLMLGARSKIFRSVVGTHFYQTDPKVLEDFVDDLQMRFVKQPTGVFHPKVYVFEKDRDWHVLIGSANFTKGALRSNSELMTHITGVHGDDRSILLEARQAIEAYWQDASKITKKYCVKYRALHELNKQRLAALGGGATPSDRAPIDMQISTMNWKKFCSKVRQDRHHGLELRLSLLDEVRHAFDAHDHFNAMNEAARRLIAGVRVDHPAEGWFGGMNAARYFTAPIAQNVSYVSEALDEIPMLGDLKHDHLRRYGKTLRKAFPNGGLSIGGLTRLVAMKRPDQCICLVSANRDRLAKDLGIAPTTISWDSYFDDVIVPIHGSLWWNSPMPDDGEEIEIWKGRVAMLDSIYFEPKRAA